MTIFSYNDMYFSIEPTGNSWEIVCKRSDGKTACVAARVFPNVPETEAEVLAIRLVKTMFPVGVNVVGPDVAHPMRIGDLRIVGPDVGHPSFIYWDKDSSSCPRQL